MERSVRYELLPDADHADDSEPVIVADTSVSIEPGASTPSNQSTEIPNTHADDECQVTGVKMPEPPSYNIATSLPSYEEAEQTKQSEEDLRQQNDDIEQQTPNNSTKRVGDIYLGTDGIFLCSFLVAFLFNCVGLFAILCVSQTIAARFGAVSGFGLSIMKYVAFMKYQNYISSTWNDGFSWLWWFMLFLGMMMLIRGAMQYIRIKNQWAKLSQQTRGRIYLYF